MSGLTHLEWEILRRAALSNGVTILLIGVLVWSAFKLRAWYREDSGPAADRHELLLVFKDLQRQGDLTDEEFRSIKGRLSGQVADDSAATGRELDGAGDRQELTRTDAPSGTDVKTEPPQGNADGRTDHGG